MGYHACCYTDCNAWYSYERMENDTIFYFTGHGGPGYIKFPDNSLIIASSPYPFHSKLSGYDNGELDDMLLIVYNGCNTANDDPDLGDLLDESISLGVKTAIGFKAPLGNDE